MTTNSDKSYEQWLINQLTELQTNSKNNIETQNIHEPNHSYFTNKYIAPSNELNSITSKWYLNWQTILGWTCVLGATIATFNIMLHSIRTVCPMKVNSTDVSSIKQTLYLKKSSIAINLFNS